MSENTFKKEPEKQKPAREKRGSNLFMGILDGSIVTNPWIIKQLPFILFLVLLAVLNITNTISVEKKHREKKGLEKELSLLRAKDSYYSGKAAKNIKPSELTKKLERYGLKIPSEPVIKIKK